MGIPHTTHNFREMVFDKPQEVTKLVANFAPALKSTHEPHRVTAVTLFSEVSFNDEISKQLSN